MVFHRVYEENRISEILQHGGHIRMQGITNRVGQEEFPIFRAEDEMDRKSGNGLRHVLEPSQGNPSREIRDLEQANPDEVVHALNETPARRGNPGRCGAARRRVPCGKGPP